MESRLHAARAFTRRNLAALAGGASVAALVMAAPGLALAADAPASEPTTVDAVVVTGLKASLANAIAVKRASDVIVDSIASEDLGKFPDSNVAESLQRITGVSIDRDQGEGRLVTVRGFGPQYNSVLVNGRTLASENPGREFSFDLLAADLISGADVYKSSNAALQEGGIGSTINLKTARPLDIKGQKIVLSAKENYEDLSGKSSPDLFGLYSNTFMDGRLGVLGSVSYQQRQARIDSAVVEGYNHTSVGGNVGAPILNVSAPADYYQLVDQEDRKRTAVTGTVQYRATDNLTLTFDGIYNKFDVKSVASEVSHYFTPGDLTNVTLDANRTVTSFTQNTVHTDYVATNVNRPTELKMAGFNADWHPNDHVNIKFDTSWSQAEDNNGGKKIFAVIGFTNPATFTSTGGGLPNLTAVNSFVNPALGRAHFATYQGSNIRDTVYETRLDGVFKTDYENFTEVRAGAIYSDRTKTNQLIQTSSNVWCTYCGYPIPVPASLLKAFSPSGGFLSGEGGNFPRQWLTYDPKAYFAFLESQAAANAVDAATGKPIGTSYANILALGGYKPVLQPSSYEVNEKVFGGYLQADFKGVIGGMKWNATVGGRYVHTELTSTGTEQPLTQLDPNPLDSTTYNATFGTSAPITQSTAYDNFLPSLNVKVDVAPDMLVRFAASQTLTRPNLTDLAPQLTYTNLRPGVLLAAGGNPALTPMKSTNFDLSYEWYYQKSGYFTVAAFYKDLKDFIVDGVANEVFPVTINTTPPSSSATFAVTRPRNVANAEVHGIEIGFQHTFDYLPAPFDGLGVTANATFVSSGAGSGPGLALPGLGDSQNLVGFYAKGPIEVRVAYNHRDGFLSTQSNPTGGDPINTKSAGQIDVQASYRVTPNLTLVAEGINLNDAQTRTYGQYASQFVSLVETGPRYAVGARLTF